MIIQIKGKAYPVSKQMQEHFSVPIQHANTIVEQINSGMYDRWFKEPNMVCFDFGANVGLVSLYMLNYCKELHCVEPTPSHHNLLKELIMANIKDGQKVVFHDTALTGKNEIVLFASGHATENKVTSADGYGANKIQVQGKTLNNHLSQCNQFVDFCKVDIEGGEMMALTVNELKQAREKVKQFFVEVHPGFGGGMDENRNELVSRFEQAGYKTEIIDYQTIYAYE